MFGNDKWYLLTDEERKINHSRVKEGVGPLEKAPSFNAKPNAPLISRKNLKRILGKHLKKIVIAAVSILVIVLFTWMASPNPPSGGASRKLAEAKAAAEKREIKIQKEKEEMLKAKAREVNTTSQPTYAKMAFVLDYGHKHGDRFCCYVEIFSNAERKEGNSVYRYSKDVKKGHLAINPETYKHLQENHTAIIGVYVDGDFTPDPEEKKEEPKRPEKKRIEY